MTWLGQRPKITKEQLVEILRRHELFQANRPKVIAEEMGLSANIVRHYITKPPKRLTR